MKFKEYIDKYLSDEVRITVVDKPYVQDVDMRKKDKKRSKKKVKKSTEELNNVSSR